MGPDNSAAVARGTDRATASARLVSYPRAWTWFVSRARIRLKIAAVAA